MPLIEPEDFPNYPYQRRRVTIRRDPTLILWGVGLFLVFYSNFLLTYAVMFDSFREKMCFTQ